MFKQSTAQQVKGTYESQPGRRPFHFWKALIVALGSGAALALVPIALPTVANSLSGAAPHAYWYLSRASGFVAFGLLWLSMLAGLGITSKLGRFWPGMPGSFELHRYTSLLGIGFSLVHVFILLGDSYMNYTLSQLLVPFMGGSYRPEWVGFGQLAFYILLVVSFSFYVRGRLSVHTWRLIHMLSFALFLMVLVHGMNSGTDGGTLWAKAIYWSSAGSVLLGSIYRMLATRLEKPKSASSAENLVALGGRSQPR